MDMPRPEGRASQVRPIRSARNEFDISPSGRRKGSMVEKFTSTAVLLLVTGAVLRAQNPTARITGTVTDSTGAVVPGAVVTLVNDQTRVKLEGRTNESGIYLISF